MNFKPEVLIYIQTVKTYFKKNVESQDYFIGNSNEEDFFQRLGEISQQNFDKNGEVMLNKEQFESLRNAVTVTEISKEEILKNTKTHNPEEHIFIDMRGYGKICLN